MSIRIITDSTSDISQQQAKELGIIVVPLYVLFKDNQYADGIDLQLDEFYQKLAESDTLPTTSQVTPEQFLAYFNEAKENGDSVIVITLSSLLSGTYQSAVIAKDTCEYDNIYLVDSLNVTLGLQILVLSAVDMVAKGLPVDEIVQILETDKTKIHLYAIVENLEYLKKGGRLSSVSAFAGTILNIKPIIEVKDGKVGVAGKARGTTSAYGKLLQFLDQAGGINYSKYHCVGYTGDIRNLDPFLEYTKGKIEETNRLTSPIGTVVGTHAGPGACGIAFFE